MKTKAISLRAAAHLYRYGNIGCSVDGSLFDFAIILSAYYMTSSYKTVNLRLPFSDLWTVNTDFVFQPPSI